MRIWRVKPMLLMFILVIAAANLCLGFAAAMYLGVGPRSWPPEFNLRWPKPLPADDEHEEPPAPSAPARATAVEPKPLPTVDKPPISNATEPETESALPPLAQVLERLARGFDLFEAELAHWDNRRRDNSLDADELANSTIELMGLASGYVEQLQNMTQAIEALEPANPAASVARDEVTNHIAQLAERLSAGTAELQQLQVADSDAATAGAALTTALLQMLGQLHEARNQLEEPLITLAGTELHDPAIVPTLQKQAETSLLGRLCFEHLWQDSEMMRISGDVGAVAMLDVDGLRQVNAKYGPHVARQALRSIGRIAAECAGHETIVARLLGKQFVLSLPHHAPQAAAEVVEQIRQQIEHTRWRSQTIELELTVSAAVVSATMEDSPQSVLDRMRSTVREAKSYGRNRTFLWEDHAPTPVVPPPLTIEPRAIDV